MFSEEMVVKLRKTRKNSEIYFWRRSSERFETRISIDTQIQRGGNVTVWGCFSFFGFGCIETFYSTMNAQHYTEETLPNFLLPSVDMLNPPRRTFVFQQDNSTPHTANVTKNYLREKIFHCSNSPDLNPIENVWGRIKKKMALDPPKTPEEAAQKVRGIWFSLPEDYAQILALSVPTRLRNAIARRGYRF